MQKLLDKLQQSNTAQFFVVGLLLAIFETISGHFSIILLAAVLVSIIPPLLNLTVIKHRLTYDQKHNTALNFLVLSSILWSISLWNNLSEAPQNFVFVYAALTSSALILFDSSKRRLAVIVPLFVTFVVVLAFVRTPAETLTVVFIFVILILLLFLKRDSSYKTLTKDGLKVKEGAGDSGKMEYISEIDSLTIENNQLINNIKQIEIELSAAEMAKMEFLATMSHEIRTPLNGIIPLLDIMLDSGLTEIQKDYLSTAHVSAIQMQKLIDDLLDYSKVEAGKLTVESRGLKIPRILEAVKASYQKAANKKNISIEVKIHKNVSPLLRGDPTRLRQVLSNLLSNAIKFSTYGTIQLVANKIKDYPNKEIIRFEIIDQGIGLNKETSDAIFLPFTQEDGSSTRKFGGTGLGLAISKKIVELMHGTIAVKSKKGKGSTFYFDLPLLKSVGETDVGPSGKSDFQAILVNTNPLLFNKLSQKLKDKDVTFQKALGLSQAYEIYAAINKGANRNKNVLVFIDFETAGKQVRSLCNDLKKDETMNNLFACVLTENKSIAGIPKLANIKLLSKTDSVSELLNKIEVMQATLEVVDSSIEDTEDTEDAEETTAEDIRQELLDQDSIGDIKQEVLLVEDNEINLKVAEKLIQYIGYPFDFAVNGAEALEKIKQNRYRMILMDCQMPVMDGYLCTQKTREYEKATGLNHTPIIAMTANAMMGDREKCLKAGMDDYMSKPLNRYILEKTLKKWDPFALMPDLSVKQQEAIKKVQYNQTINDTQETQESEEQSSKDITKENLEKKPEQEQKHIEQENQQAAAKDETEVTINQKWLNTKAVQEIKEFMGEEVLQLLEMFQQETPTILTKIRNGLKANDKNEIKKMAHMLKSTSANIGASGLSFFSRKLELASSENKEISVLITIYTKINKAYSLTKKEIKKYVDSHI